MKNLQGVIQILGVKKHDDILIRKEQFLSDINSLYSSGYHVTDVSWWKRKRITDKEFDSVAGGGVKDEHDANYYWAETIFNKNFEDCADITDVATYYNDCIADSTFDNLTPSISIKQ